MKTKKAFGAKKVGKSFFILLRAVCTLYDELGKSWFHLIKYKIYPLNNAINNGKSTKKYKEYYDFCVYLGVIGYVTDDHNPTVIKDKTMQKFTLTILLLFGHIFLFGQDNKKLHIQHLTDNFFIYTTYKDLNGFIYQSNSMYLVTENGVVLFDTPWDTTLFQPLLDSIFIRHNKEVVLAISTHYHDDRTAGLEFLKQQNIKTYSSKLTYDLCKEYNEKQAEFYFENDTTFSIGNYKFETYYAGEGHTKDNIVIWFDQYKILYGGCLVKSTENKNLGNVADANIKEWTPTIKKVIRKYPKPKFVIPGHFGWTSNKGLKHTLKLLRQNK